MRLSLPQMHLSLKTKFVLIISLLISVTSIILSVFLIERQSLLIQTELEKRGESLVRNLAHTSEYGVLVESKHLLANLMKGLFQEEDVVYIIIQDKRGDILTEWNRAEELRPSFQARKLQVVKELFKEKGPAKRYFTVGGKEYYNFSFPIKTTRVERSKEEVGLLLEMKKGLVTREEEIGTAQIGMCLEHMRKEISDMKRMVVLLTILAIGVGILLTIFLVNIFIKPVKRLVQATEKVAGGDLSQKVEVTTRDEIGTLASSFNRMITSLEESRARIEEYNRTLENKVKERTAELEEALKTLKETQSQLIQVEKMAAVGQLAAGVAHELNNPLGGILGYSQFAIEKINQKPISGFNQEDAKTILQYLKDIEGQTKRCRSIIQNLLKFSRASRREEFGQTDVNSVLKDTFSFIRHPVEKGKIRLVEKLADSLPKIKGHPGQLQQVFTNLILNAVQAMPEGGILTVESRLREYPNAVEISFTDTGEGIPEENLDKIFEPFFTTKKVGEGTGLGLSVSYGLIKNHGGEIRVKSKKKQGTTFTVILPISKQQITSKQKDESIVTINR